MELAITIGRRKSNQLAGWIKKKRGVILKIASTWEPARAPGQAPVYDLPQSRRYGRPLRKASRVGQTNKFNKTGHRKNKG